MPLLSARSSEKHYDTISRCLHWLMAFFILGMLACGLSLPYMGEWKPVVIEWHKSFGICLLALAILRLGWRLLHAPPPSEPLPFWMNAASTASHAALYLLMFAIPLTGWYMVSAFDKPVQFFSLGPLPNLMEKDRAWAIAFRQWHWQLAYALIALIILHIGAALYHHFIRKDGILRRMWKG